MLNGALAEGGVAGNSSAADFGLLGNYIFVEKFLDKNAKLGAENFPFETKLRTKLKF